MALNAGRVEDIFSEAVAMAAPDVRAAYLDGACAGDAELRARVESLLAAHERGGGSLQLPSTVEAQLGAVVGRYKLLEQIGEGGFGVVFMAEQTSPVRRRVALKIIKLGMDTKQVIARFEAERQALAMMDHENIARVFDAGATDTGRPYFVMELVRGTPITSYCDENKLSTRQRLKLFITVCSAVQHAHQKGIIHRDLKPNNVLVTMHDDKAVAKVIDFGVAKATQSRLTDRTLFTEFRQMIGTPAYMSPEQAQMSGLDVDTRSDIYALGVLLYELLTGTTPFDTKELHDASFDQMQRLICDTEPPRPSTRIATFASDRQVTTAGARATDPRRLTQSIRGDLDWMVMKCLEKDRNRRYETANALCRDVERYLADEAVHARPPTRTYRMRKFVRRNRLMVVASSAVVVALIVGATLATIGLVGQSRQRAIAEQNATKAILVKEYLEKVLASADPTASRGNDYTVRQLLDDTASNLGSELAAQPEVEADLRATIGRAYRRLGDLDKSEQHLARSLELRRHIFGPRDERVAEALVHYASTLREQRRFEPGRAGHLEAEDAAREAIAIYRERGITGQPLMVAMDVLAVIHLWAHEYDELEAVCQEALEIARRNGVDCPEVGGLYSDRAQGKLDTREFPAAEQFARAGLEIITRFYGEDHVTTAISRVRLGQALANQQRLLEGFENYSNALATLQKKYPDTHYTIGWTLDFIRELLQRAADARVLASLFPDPQDLSALERRFRAAFQSRPERHLNWADPPLTAARGLPALVAVYAKLGSEYADAGMPGQAEEARRRGDALLEDLTNHPPEDAEVRAALAVGLVAALFDIGRIAEAKSQCREVLQLNPATGHLHNDLAWRLATAADPARREPGLAVELAVKAVQISPGDGMIWNTLGVARYRAGEFSQAVADLEKAMQLRRGGDSFDFFFLAMAYWQLGETAEACQFHEKGVTWMDTNRPKNEELRRFRDEAAQLLHIPQTQPATVPAAH